jgi:hypothetical protein
MAVCLDEYIKCLALEFFVQAHLTGGLLIDPQEFIFGNDGFCLVRFY